MNKGQNNKHVVFVNRPKKKKINKKIWYFCLQGYKNKIFITTNWGHINAFIQHILQHRNNWRKKQSLWLISGVVFFFFCSLLLTSSVWMHVVFFFSAQKGKWITHSLKKVRFWGSEAVYKPSSFFSVVYCQWCWQSCKMSECLQNFALVWTLPKETER